MSWGATQLGRSRTGTSTRAPESPEPQQSHPRASSTGPMPCPLAAGSGLGGHAGRMPGSHVSGIAMATLGLENSSYGQRAQPRNHKCLGTCLSVCLEELGLRRLWMVERTQVVHLGKAGALGPLSMVSWTPQHQPEWGGQWGSGQQDPPAPTPATRKSPEKHAPFPWWAGLWPVLIEGAFSLQEEFIPIPTLHYFQARPGVCL